MAIQVEVEVEAVRSKHVQPALRKGFNYYRNSTFLALLAGYAGYYLCRQNLGAAFNPMQVSLGLTTLQLGWISSCGTLAYALGKFFAAPLADSKMGGKFIFFFGLFTSSLFCFIFGLGKGMSFFVVTWSLNRFFQSMGWSGLVNVMSHWFPKNSYGTAMGIMSAGYQVGGGLVSLLVGLILFLGGNWQSLFIIPSLTLILIGITSYPFLKQDPKDVGLALIEANPLLPALLNSNPPVAGQTPYLQRFLVLLSNPAFLGMLALSFILTFIRECFNLWMPTYFTSMGETASSAAVKSTIFPFFGCLGTVIGGYTSDRYFSGRRAPIMAMLIFILIICLAGIGHLDWITGVIQSHFYNFSAHKITHSDIAVALVGAIGFFLLGSYSFVGGVVALDFGGKENSGTAAGLLDGFGYLGATLAGVFIAQIVMRSGWNQTFFLMAGVAGIGIIICIILWNLEPNKDF